MIYQILTVITSILSLIVAFKVYRRRVSKLSIIQLSETELFRLNEFKDKISYNYNDKVYEFMSAFELVIYNNGGHALTKEDILDDSPLELYFQDHVEIKEVKIISKQEGFEIDFKQVESSVLRLIPLSLDTKTSIRVQILCSGTNPTLSSRGRLRNAKKGISELKKHNGVNLFNNTDVAFSSLKKAINILVFATLLCLSLDILVNYFLYMKPKALILQSHEQQEAAVNTLIADSILTNDPTAVLIYNSNDTFPHHNYSEKLIITADFVVDSTTLELYNELFSKGYDIQYDYGQLTMEDKSKYDHEYHGQRDYQNRAILDEVSMDDFLNEVMIDMSVFAFITFLIISYTLYKSKHQFWYFIQYRMLITETEKQKLLESNQHYLLSSLFEKLLLKRV